MTDPRAYWICFSYVKGIGAVRFKAILDTFGDAESAWNAPPEALHSAGLSAKIIGNFRAVRVQLDPDQVWERLQRLGITALTWDDADYPRRLKDVDQPPPVLYARQALAPADEWAVGIVGTRRATPYGRQVTEELARVLANSGVTVVSGLARGIDAVAHQAALRAGGRTIAVLGSGPDHIYPPEHRRLAEEIIAQGAVLSDYPPGTPPDAANFPPRNRIISGISIAVVVVEAGDTSGALITANFAVEQGRDVFAVPGSITSAQSKGTNRLIKQGAIPMLDPQDVLEALNLNMVTQHRQARLVIPADPTEERLLKAIGAEPTHIDEIQNQSGLPIEQVAAALSLMELKGMVRQVGGMHYVGVRELPADYQG